MNEFQIVRSFETKNGDYWVAAVTVDISTAPTNYANMSLAADVKTGVVYYFDKATGTWSEFGEG